MVRNIDNSLMLQNTTNTSKIASTNARVHDTMQSIIDVQRKQEIERSQKVVEAKGKAEATRATNNRVEEKKEGEGDGRNKRQHQQEGGQPEREQLPSPLMIRKRFNATI